MLHALPLPSLESDVWPQTRCLRTASDLAGPMLRGSKALVCLSIKKGDTQYDVLNNLAQNTNQSLAQHIPADEL